MRRLTKRSSSGFHDSKRSTASNSESDAPGTPLASSTISVPQGSGSQRHIRTSGSAPSFSRTRRQLLLSSRATPPRRGARGNHPRASPVGTSRRDRRLAAKPRATARLPRRRGRRRAHARGRDDPLLARIAPRERPPRARVRRPVPHHARHRVPGSHGELDAALVDDGLWERVAHIHVKDYAGSLRDSDGNRRYLIPGEGEIDFDGIFDTLRRRAYEGALTLEVSAVSADGLVSEQRFRQAQAWLEARPWLLPFEVPTPSRQNARPYETGRLVKHHFENHDLVTERGSQLIDVTGEVHAAVERADVANGMVLDLLAAHDVCGRHQRARKRLHRGLQRVSRRAGARGGPLLPTRRHRHPHGGTRRRRPPPERLRSHIRAGVLSSSSQTIPIVDGSLMLGRWQRVFFCELDALGRGRSSSRSSENDHDDRPHDRSRCAAAGRVRDPAFGGARELQCRVTGARPCDACTPDRDLRLRATRRPDRRRGRRRSARAPRRLRAGPPSRLRRHAGAPAPAAARRDRPRAASFRASRSCV